MVTEEKIQEAKTFYQLHFQQAVFDEEGWRKVLEVRTKTARGDMRLSMTTIAESG